MRRAFRLMSLASPTRFVAVSAVCGLLAACDKASMPRVTFDQPPVNVAPIAVTIVLEPDVTGAILEQSVCDTQLWQGKIGPTLVKKLVDAGKVRVRSYAVTTADRAASAAAAPNSYLVRLRMLQHELIGKDRTGSSDQYQARLHVDLAATYQAVRADGSTQTLGEGPLRFAENVSVFTPRVGQAGGRCMTNSLDTALDQATESLADQLYSVASQFPPDGVAAGATLSSVSAQARTESAVAAVAPTAASGVAQSQQHSTAAPLPSTPTTPSAQPALSSQADVRRTDNPTYAVIVGLRSYRTPWAGPGTSLDVDRLVHTLRQQVGIPMDHIMVLEDELANRLDIDEAITHWLAGRVTPQSVVYVYFAGHAGVDMQTGEIYLAPYDATAADPTARFLSLRRLQSQVARLNPKLGVICLDTPTTLLSATASKDRKAAKPPAAPNWRGSLTAAAGTGLVLQFARAETPADAMNLLAGLEGSADADHDGKVTAGELLKSLKNQVLTAPLVSASAPALGTVLARPAP